MTFIDFRAISRACFDFDRLSASCHGGLTLKREQKEILSYLLEGKDVLAVPPTGFRFKRCSPLLSWSVFL